MQARWRPWRDPLWWIGALALAAAYAWAGYRTTTFLPDERLYVPLARWLPAHLPASLFEMAPYQRGPQRLDTIALAPAFALAHLPVSFAAGHAVQGLLLASTALPVALLAQRLGLSRGARLVASLGSVLVPAAIVATSFLPDALAYALFAWALWGVWLALAEPSPRHDCLALGLCVLAALARTQLIVLLALPLGAAALATLADRGPARSLWRDHRMLVVTGLAGALAVLALLATGQLHTLLGGYVNAPSRSLGQWLRDYALDVAHLDAEVAFVPLALAVPWLLAGGARAPAARAFWATALAATALVAVSLLRATRDERYLLYFVPIVLLAAALHIRQRRSWVPVAFAAVALGVLVAGVSWTADRGPVERFVFPTETLLRDAVVRPAGALVLGLAVAGVGLLAAAAIRRPPGAAVVTLVAGLVLYAVAALTTTLVDFGRGLGRFSGPGAATRGWVDARAGGATVGVLALGGRLGGDPGALVYWNGTVKRLLSLGAPPPQLPVGSARLPIGVTAARVRVSPSGTLSAPGGVPSLLVVPGAPALLGLDGSVLARSAVYRDELVRRGAAAHVRFLLSAGVVRAGAPASVHVFEPSCLLLSAPPRARVAINGAVRADPSIASTLRPGRYQVALVTPLAARIAVAIRAAAC